MAEEARHEKVYFLFIVQADLVYLHERMSQRFYLFTAARYSGDAR